MLFWVFILNWLGFGCGFKFAYLSRLRFLDINLGLIQFILICHILDLVDYACILTLNLQFWTRAYSMWDVFVELYLLI